MPKGGWNDQFGKLTAAEREDIRSRYVDKGQSTKEIGAALGVQGMTISRWLKRLGVVARPEGRPRGRSAKPGAQKPLAFAAAYVDLDHTIEPFEYTGRPY